MQVQQTNVEFKKIIIRNTAIGSSIDLIAEQNKRSVTDNSYVSFDSLLLNEDINEPSLSGSLNITDNNNYIDKLNLKGSAEIEVWINFYDTIDNTGNYKTTSKKLYFDIIDIKTVTDLANQRVSGNSGTPNKLVIRFASRGFVYTNFNTAFTEDFIGTISNEFSVEEPYKNSNQEEDTPNPKVSCKKVTKTSGDEKNPITESFYMVNASWLPDGGNPRSFICKVVDFLNNDRISPEKKPLESHSSWNDVYIKAENFYYPRFKPSQTSRLTNLINYVKEYTVLDTFNYEDVEPARAPKSPIVDFMFWEDLDKYNFKSISKLVQDTKQENIILYYFDMNELDMGSIVSMEIIKDIEITTLFNDGVLTSEYIHVTPNWKSPYRKYLDAGEELTRRFVRYSYTSDFWKSQYDKQPKTPVIAREYLSNNQKSDTGYPLFVNADLGLVEFPNNFNTTAFTYTDLNFGFYDKATYNSSKKNIPWWEFVGDGAFGYTFNQKLDNPVVGAKLYGGSIGATLIYKDTSNHNGRYENEFWQAQYDFSELPGAGLYVTLRNIKWKLNEKRKKYAEAKALKEKWRVYKEQICCERKIPTNFFALITKAEKIYGGGATGIQIDNPKTFSTQKDNGGFYAYDWVEVEFWPRSDVTAILQNGEEIIKFDGHEDYPFVFVKPRGALEGHGITQKIYKPTQRNSEDPSYKRQPGGATGLNRSSLEGKKYWTKDSRAYNLNEILNTAGMTLNKKDSSNPVFNALKQSLKLCKTLIANPGVSSRPPNDTNDKGCVSSYPKAFSMMPVGQFRLITDCSQKEVWRFGRIVQMSAIPKELMQTMTKYQEGKIVSVEGDGTTQQRTNSSRSPQAAYSTVGEYLVGGSTEIAPISIEHESRTSISERLKAKDVEQGEEKYKLKAEQQFFNQSPYMFVFDVENAHDGLCDGTCPS